MLGMLLYMPTLRWYRSMDVVTGAEDVPATVCVVQAIFIHKGYS